MRRCARGATGSNFCFGTRLTRVTRALAGSDPDAALQRAAAEVVDWDGGTRIGECLKRFLDEHGHGGSRGGRSWSSARTGWRWATPSSWPRRWPGSRASRTRSSGSTRSRRIPPTSRWRGACGRAPPRRPVRERPQPRQSGGRRGGAPDALKNFAVSVRTLFSNALVVTMDNERTELDNGWLLAEDGLLVDVGDGAPPFASTSRTWRACSSRRASSTRTTTCTRT